MSGIESLIKVESITLPVIPKPLKVKLISFP